MSTHAEGDDEDEWEDKEATMAGGFLSTKRSVSPLDTATQEAEVDRAAEGNTVVARVTDSAPAGASTTSVVGPPRKTSLSVANNGSSEADNDALA